MSEMLEVTRQDLAASSDLRIKKAGSVTVPAMKFCIWESPSGPTSTLIVTNKGDNTLTVEITGAPDAVNAENGQRLNGSWTIPGKSAAIRIKATADFKGREVHIFNTSDPATKCDVVATS